MDAQIHRNLLNFGIGKTTFLVTRPTRKRDFAKMKSTEFNEQSMKIRSKNKVRKNSENGWKMVPYKSCFWVQNSPAGRRHPQGVFGFGGIAFSLMHSI